MATSLLAGDLKITAKTETKMGLTSKSTDVSYLSERYQRTNNEKDKKDTLFDYSTFTRYEIDHKKKVIAKITLDDMQKAMDMAAKALAESDDGSGEKIMKMLGVKDGSAPIVNKTGKDVVVGKACDKWNITLGEMKYSASACPGLTSPVPLEAKKKAVALGGGTMLTMLGDPFMKLLNEMEKIEGLHLKSEMLVPLGPMTVRVSREAMEIIEGSIPASVFELPKGYKEVDAGKKMLEDMEKQLAKSKKK